MRKTTIIVAVLIGLWLLDSYNYNGRHWNALTSIGSQLIHHFLRW
jgi:hypothetical protein